MIYLLLFFEFFKIGLFTIGGGYAMIPLVKETVLAHSWMSEELFNNFLGICEATPGPIALNMATFVGNKVGGVFGSVLATLGLILPSFIIILLICIVLTKLTNNKHYKNIMKGIRPVVAGLIIAAGIILFFTTTHIDLRYFSSVTQSYRLDYKTFIILGVLIVIELLFKFVIKKKFNNIYYILISAALGLLIFIITK